MAEVREGRPEGQRGLVPQAFVHSSSDVFRVYFHTVKAAKAALVLIATA